MGQSQEDNWEEHWTHYADTAEKNPAQLFRHSSIIKLLKELPSQEPLRLIDFGSGQGDMAFLVSQALPGIKLLGIELSQAGVDISKKKLPQAAFIQRDLLQPKDPPLSYHLWGNCGICSEVLEHVEEPEKMLLHMKEFLAPSAKIVFTVPGGPMSSFDHHIGHRKHYTKQEFIALLRRCGYEVKRAYSAGFPFFNLYRLIVIARGKKLIEDVKKGSQENKTSRLADFVMFIFRLLFPFNLLNTPWGWQIIVVVEKK